MALPPPATSSGRGARAGCGAAAFRRKAGQLAGVCRLPRFTMGRMASFFGTKRTGPQVSRSALKSAFIARASRPSFSPTSPSPSCESPRRSRKAGTSRATRRAQVGLRK